MGTPEFAVNTLECLIESEHEVVAVFTQPDKPQGRKQQLVMPPVKETALAHGIPVYQPVKIREPEYVERIKALEPDVIVVAAFGQILPKEILDTPRYGCINVHASLLPRYRGAAPIQWSIINGDEKTGITIMRMDVGLDTGDMILQRAVPIEADDTADTLFDKLAVMGGPMVLEVLEQLLSKTAVYQKQDEGRASHVTMIKKEMGLVDWTKPAVVLERLVRGLNSWPCAYTFLDGKQMKIWSSEVCPADTAGAVPGQILSDEQELIVATGDGALKLCELQLAGKKRMQAQDFLRGCHGLKNTVLGSMKDE
jgi:methionyl-tRNA formyltransferase